MARPPSQKGISFLPVVEALKQLPNGRNLVPPRLLSYFDEHLVVSGWYPERDYWVLLEALVKTIDARTVGGDVWRYFAKFSAKRDISGRAAPKAGADRAEATGPYRNFASADAGTLENFFRYAARLWSQYHDTGKMEVAGARLEQSAVVVRLSGFVIPIEGFVRLQGYYVEEYSRLVGLEMVSAVTRSTARGDTLCEWEYRLSPGPATTAYLASLVQVP